MRQPAGVFPVLGAVWMKGGDFAARYEEHDMSIFQTQGHHSTHIWRFVGIVLAVVVGFAVLMDVIDTVMPSPTPTAPAPVHVVVAPGTPSRPAQPASTAPALPAGPILLPAQVPGGAMQTAHAQIAIASGMHVDGPWVDLGDAVIHAPTASFSTVPPHALQAVAPSSGGIRVRWSGWMQAPIGGVYMLAMRVSGGPTQSVAMTVDGIAQPIASAKRACGWMGSCDLPPSTAAGAVALAQGWHEVQVEVITQAVGEQAVSVTIYARAPDSGTPAVLMPSWPVKHAQAVTP